MTCTTLQGVEGLTASPIHCVVFAGQCITSFELQVIQSIRKGYSSTTWFHTSTSTELGVTMVTELVTMLTRLVTMTVTSSGYHDY